jgi:thiol-disulfide isomerase/thioredoxin
VKRTLLIASAAALLAGLALGQAINPSRKAPELAFTLPGEGEKLLSQYRGKVIALDFILTTCPHCQAAAKALSGFQDKYGKEGFQALDLAINGLDENRTPTQAADLVRGFAQTYGATNFPVGWVNRDAMPSFMGFSFVERSVVPQVVLIDRKGFIRYQTPATGDSELRQPEVVERHVQELLSESTSQARHLPNGSKTIVVKKSSSW